MSRVAILWWPGTLTEDTFRKMLKKMQAAAGSIGVVIQVVEAANVSDFDSAFSAMAKERVEWLIVLINPMFSFSGRTLSSARQSTDCRPSTSGSHSSKVEASSPMGRMSPISTGGPQDLSTRSSKGPNLSTSR